MPVTGDTNTSIEYFSIAEIKYHEFGAEGKGKLCGKFDTLCSSGSSPGIAMFVLIALTTYVALANSNSCN
jgi:hypothetical protein